MKGLLFSNSHEWVKIDHDIATVGISDYAQSQLGDVVFIELPQEGSSFDKNSQFATIESTKTASEVYMPLSGEVIKVNSELTNNPQWINNDPYDKGWIVKLKIKNISETESLMKDDAYKDFVEKEAH
ncbi:MAG: glycine cleavage system protein GcvH [Candidatus Omnitrophica bacterium]|nr:glycine cleavage system protein GcvH [Candidatus Omnitrophota bacterium]